MGTPFWLSIFLFALSINLSSAQHWFSVSAGGQFSLAIRSDATLWTWGYNENGELGQGDNKDRLFPTQITSEIKWKYASAGAFHVLAIDEDGFLYGWGMNKNGELGLGTYVNSNSPKLISKEGGWLIAAAGKSHSAAISSDSSLWLWGYNNSGQLGHGKNDPTLNRPMKILPDSHLKWISVDVGGWHTLALDSKGQVWSFGYNRNGQLGDGTTIDRNLPRKIDGLPKIMAISAGHEYSMALDIEGNVWTWGFNGNGQLGTGKHFNEFTPKKIAVPENVQSIQANGACSFVISESNHLYSFGFGGFGSLGHGNELDYYTPTKVNIEQVYAVSPATGFLLLGAVYGYHTLLLTDQKNSICVVGQNLNGELGNGTTNPTTYFNCETGAISVIPEYITKDQILIHSNTVNSTLSIEILSGSKDRYPIQILSPEGKSIYRGTSFLGAATFDITDIKPGVYLLKIDQVEMKIIII